MRLKILLIILLIDIILFSSNVTGTNYRAVYDFEYTKDSINSIIEKDILYLEISKNSSFCFSYYTYYTDSLGNTPNGRAIWRKLFSAAIAKDGSNATSFPYKRSTFMVTKCYASDIICIKDIIYNDIYEYNTPKNDFHWQLCDSTKTISGFEAYKATCSYHGREWVVWYSPEIPFSDGPWVFCGLPGLILEAQDKEGLFSFRLVGLMSSQKLKKDWLDKGRKIDRISFLRKKYKYLKNLRLMFNAEMGTNIPESDNDTRYLYGLEPDFKQ